MLPGSELLLPGAGTTQFCPAFDPALYHSRGPIALSGRSHLCIPTYLLLFFLPRCGRFQTTPLCGTSLNPSSHSRATPSVWASCLGILLPGMSCSVQVWGGAKEGPYYR